MKRERGWKKVKARKKKREEEEKGRRKGLS